MYTGGYGVDKDEKQAIAWARKSAAQGNQGAICLLAVIYPDDAPNADDRPVAALADMTRRALIAESPECKSWGFYGKFKASVSIGASGEEGADGK